MASSREINGQIKEEAARFVERVGSWADGESSSPEARLALAGYPADLVDEARVLVDVGDQQVRSASIDVVYPQYGGLTPDSASVIVLARQLLRTPAGATTRDFFADIRLVRDGTSWRVTSRIDPARPPLRAGRAGGPTTLGAAVLAHPRIRIPAPSRADIVERRVEDPILTVLLDLASRYDIQLNAALTGHPRTVFPTTRLSNHAVGRALDIRAIDGVAVIDMPREGPVLRAFMTAAGAAGATEVGGPILVSGTGFFTDDVHQDHIHLGITPGRPTATAR
ncbi:MAG: hypothetical protein ABS81_11555 [Pseudonocardia sp. SCN 72-86]|nr:MAG: hypothetical protein ABS81_11555 [Pseudonocardia sp. SCN 72-86]